VVSSGVSTELLPGRGTQAGTEFKLQNKLDKVRLGCCTTSVTVVCTDMACAKLHPL
jgi:hypothetical protein